MAFCDYENYADKDGLRVALARDQRSLCCYCMTRIEATGTAMKIAHHRSQRRYPGEQLSYRNLLGACNGGEGQPKHLQHCDTRQGDRDVKFNPADATSSVELRVRYRSDGTIASSDQEFDAQLNEVLNLNLPLLRNRRKAVIDSVTKWLRTFRNDHHRGPDSATLRRERARWDPSTGSLDAYAPVAVWWLDQRLAGSTP
jgi:uncharacterized protein (TIGR02646 family)